MSSEELAGLEKLQAYVNSFVPARCVNRAGNPVFDTKGNERMEKRVINTKELLGYNMSGFAERMLKLAADKKASKNKAKGRPT
ncbi:hypothetical protein A2U01_0050445, partial [Trifolium medium]|nr:hypothetical protein [Trifolium medium]